MKNPTRSDAITSDTSVKEVKKIILQLEAIVEESHDAIIGKALDGTIVTWNGGATRLFGYIREEMIGNSIADLFAPGNRDELPGLLEKIKKGETIADYDSIWIKKDGTNAEVEFSLSPIHSEKGLIVGSSLVGRDVTEKKKVEKKTREAERQYHDFFSTSQEGVFITSEDGKFIDFNNTAMEIFGYKNREEAYEVPVFSLYESKEERLVFLDIINRQGHVKEYPIKLKRKDGLILDTLITIKILQSEDFSERRYFGTVRDITESKLAAEKLKEEEEKYKRLFDGAADLIAVVDLRGNFIELNKKFEEESGWSRKEMIGRNVVTSGIVTLGSAPKILYAIGQIIAKGNTPIFEIVGVNKKGEEVPYEARVVPVVNNGKMVGIQAILRNITERKNAEAALRFKNIILSTQQEASLDGILVVDENSKIISSNKLFADMWGIPKELIEAGDDEVVLKVVMDRMLNPQEFLGKVKYLYANKEEISNEEINLNDGRVFERYSAPMIGEEYYGRVWYFRDITEKKNMDKKIIEINNKILNIQKTKNEFVSIAAHQLRSPITVMMGNASILREEAEKGTFTAEQKGNIEDILVGAKNMNELVEFLLKVTRAESGKVKMELNPINLEDVTNTVVGILKAELNNKNQEVEIEKKPIPFPYVLMEMESIKQVILNLISNANRYSPQNSKIKVSMIFENASVMDPEKSNIVFSVKDSGIGIPKEAQDKLFNRFFRADNARAMVSEGTGLGLSLAKSLVEAWGGKLWFESEENKGTTFYFTLPFMGKREPASEVTI